MKEKINIILILLVFIFLPFFMADARSGCCSHHGGVCGCHCCDGTSLSATCAPYYPQCSTSKPSTQQSTTKPSITPQNTVIPQANNPIGSNLLAEVPKENSGNSAWWWVIGIGFVGYLFYNFIKRKK
jgi:hypothetical protein